ncbi:MAG: ribonuclease domain-containing protein [Roseiflexaceae bacterium]
MALLALVLSGCTGVQVAPSQSGGRVPTAAPVLRSSSGLPTVRPAELPPEARETLALIAQGGPFPFRRDGIEFQNRERLLPRKPRGYYREYTVITPGSRDRGARRIVTGEDGEIYYTEDHYESFVQVVDQ